MRIPIAIEMLHVHTPKWHCLLLGLGLPEQAMGYGNPLGLGLVAEDEPSEFSCTSYCM